MTPAEKQAHRAKVSGGDGLLEPGVEPVVDDELAQETDAASTDDESEETETDEESTEETDSESE